VGGGRCCVFVCTRAHLRLAPGGCVCLDDDETVTMSAWWCGRLHSTCAQTGERAARARATRAMHLPPQQTAVIVPQPRVALAHPVVQPLIVPLPPQECALKHLSLHATNHRHLPPPPVHLARSETAPVVAPVLLVPASPWRQRCTRAVRRVVAAGPFAQMI